jgi:hypothetical protein
VEVCPKAGCPKADVVVVVVALAGVVDVCLNALCPKAEVVVGLLVGVVVA